MKIVACLAIAACLISGCDSKRVYEFDQEFSDRSWKIGDSSKFDFVIPDATQRYNVYYNVRNSLEYPYARLFLEYALRDSAGVQLQRKLVSTYLFDQKTGKPFGDSGLGDVYDHQIPLFKGMEFKKAGKYSLRMTQFMRTDTLKGIVAVGVRVEKADGR